MYENQGQQDSARKYLDGRESVHGLFITEFLCDIVLYLYVHLYVCTVYVYVLASATQPHSSARMWSRRSWSWLCICLGCSG